MNPLPVFAPPPRRDAPVQVNMTIQERDLVRTMAAREGVSQSELVRRLIADHLRAQQSGGVHAA